MSNVIQKLVSNKLITPPSWLPDNLHYLTIMGSVAYKCSSDTSDMDIYGYCMPPKDYIFPHLAGYLYGFDNLPRFDQYQQHHVFDRDALAGKGRTYDFSIFSIVRYFNLLLENNPNVVDSLFVSEDCVLHSTQIGNLVRENRKLFLHKGAFVKFKGYLYSQYHKMDSKERTGKRKEIYDKYGWDIKFDYHCLRLADEIEQILMFGDLELGRNNEELKACRRGDLTKEEVKAKISSKESLLNSLYEKTALPDKPRTQEVKDLLLRCIEIHYGNLSNVIVKPDRTSAVLREIIEIAERAL